jgi:hypothetical protein
LGEALEAVRRVFGEGRADVKERESKDLPRELERLLGERRTWTLETNRALFDSLAEGRAARRRSIVNSVGPSFFLKGVSH